MLASFSTRAPLDVNFVSCSDSVCLVLIGTDQLRFGMGG